MGLKLVERNVVNVKVEGTLADDNGKPDRFDFTLQCKRMGADALKDALTDQQTLTKVFMADVTIGWKGVTDADGNQVGFDSAALNQLLDIPGMAGLAFNAYLEQQAVKAKN